MCADINQCASSHLCRAVPGRSMNDFVGQHGGEFRLILQVYQQTTVDGYLAAGQCPGVGHRIIEHHKLIGQLGAITYRREFFADAGDIELYLGVNVIAPALSLLGGQILLAANIDLLLGRDQRQLAFASNRIDGTASN